jgi:hypothetical protein
MPNQALARLASRPALDLNESADPLDSEDDLLADALGTADKGYASARRAARRGGDRPGSARRIR